MMGEVSYEVGAIDVVHERKQRRTGEDSGGYFARNNVSLLPADRSHCIVTRVRIMLCGPGTAERPGR
jgi:hypothetical protein